MPFESVEIINSSRRMDFRLFIVALLGMGDRGRIEGGAKVWSKEMGEKSWYLLHLGRSRRTEVLKNSAIFFYFWERGLEDLIDKIPGLKLTLIRFVGTLIFFGPTHGLFKMLLTSKIGTSFAYESIFGLYWFSVKDLGIFSSHFIGANQIRVDFWTKVRITTKTNNIP